MTANDYALGQTFDVKFDTTVNGVPTTLSGGTVVAYPGNSTTEVTGGITLSTDLDSRTGMHNVRVVATTANGYAAGTQYTLVISAGTVGGYPVVGRIVGAFHLILGGAISSGTPTSTTFISSDLTGSSTDQYKDSYVTFLTGACTGATKKITAFNAGTDTVTCDALPTAPSVGDVFVIVNGA